MTKSWRPFFGSVAITFLLAACGSDQTSGSPQTAVAEIVTDVSTARIEDHVRYLASDDLGGRAPGSKGEELTLTYLTEQYAKLGLRPGNPDGTYIQAVPLVASTLTNAPSLTLESRAGKMDFQYGEDFMCWTHQRRQTVSIDRSELVFVGYGVIAPEYDWDDYKDIDVTGKTLVMLVGDPPLPDTTQFGGRAMTYYGRWTYKYEIAAEKGAAGAIIVHNTKAAGYPWEVVVNSWAGEQFDIVRRNDGMDRCAVEGWVAESVAERIFGRAGLKLADAYRGAVSAGFQPVPLGISASVSMNIDFRDVRSYNLAALIEGSDPDLKDEYVVYTAHWDHLGVGIPSNGDSIYNGALDNATGVAATLEVARLFSKHRDRLKRTVLILNTTAEESGLLGSYYYAEYPLYPLEKTVAEINIDGLNIWGRTKDMVVVGYGASQLDDYLEKAIEHQGRHLAPDAEPEKGYYYRSDHFPFAKKGVPSLYADSGADYISRPPRWGLDMKEEYTKERYHKPEDEFETSWDLTGAVEDIDALFRVGLMVAISDTAPSWNDKSEFKRIREKSLEGSR